MSGIPESEQDRILNLLTEGALKPDEAAKLLSALSHKYSPPAKTSQEQSVSAKPDGASEASRPKSQKVELQRPDGTTYTVEVPPGLMPAVAKVVGSYVKESAKTATMEAWGGLKAVVRRQTEQMKSSVKSRVGGDRTQIEAEKPAPSLEEIQRVEERLRLLTLVHEGRISPEEANRLFSQLDMLHSRTASPTPPH